MLSKVEPRLTSAQRFAMRKAKAKATAPKRSRDATDPGAGALRVLFGRRLRELRRGRGLSLEALGERSAVDDKYIQCLETAKQAATVDMIEKLAVGLGVLPRDLFMFNDELPAATRDRIDRLLGVVGDGDLQKIARVIEALIGG